MISRSMIYEKIQDLLTLEASAAEIYKDALEYPESNEYIGVLTRIMNDELEHIQLVRRILELI